MIHLLQSWAILAFAVWASAALLPGVEVRGARGALVTAALFAILNMALGGALFALVGFSTLGLGFLFTFASRTLVNTLLLRLTDALTDQLTIRSFGWTVLCALSMSGIGTALEWALLGSRAYRV